MRHDAGQHLAETAMETQSSRRGSMYALLSEYFLQCKCQASEILVQGPSLGIIFSYLSPSYNDRCLCGQAGSESEAQWI